MSQGSVQAEVRTRGGAAGGSRSFLNRAHGRIELSDLLGLVGACLLVIIAFSPIIFGGRMLSAAGSPVAGTNGVSPFPGEAPRTSEPDIRADQGASTWAFEPWVRVNERTYSSGQLPLWNPYQGAGSPQAANMQSAPFDPLLLAVNLHPTPATWDLAIIGAFVIGAAATFLFARVLGVGAIGSFTASAAFSLSGYFFLYSNNQYVRSYVYLPILFLLVELVLRARTLLPVFGLGIATAANIYLGMPEASTFVVGAAGLYAVVRLIQARDRVPLREAAARLGGGFALGLIFAAPLLLLFQQYEGLSFNIHKAANNLGSHASPLRLALNWIVPFFSGKRVFAQGNGVSNWSGAAVMVVALAGLSGRRETRRLHAWVFFGIGVVLFLKIYGFPLIGVIGRLPVLDRVNFVEFGSPVVGFALAMTAGIGVHVLWKKDLDVRRFLALFAGGSALFLLVALLDGNWDSITAPANHYVLDTWAKAGFGVVGIVVSVVVVHRRSARWAAGIACAVVVVELLTLVPWNIYRHRADQYAAPGWLPVAQQVLKSEPDARVFGLDAKLFPDTAGGLGIQDVRVIDALYVSRYRRYVQTFLQPTMTDRFVGGPAGSSEKEVARYRDNPMFDALAVRLILSGGPLAPSPSLLERGAYLDTLVYENLDAYPRAWVVHTVHPVQNEDAAYRYLSAHGHRERGALVVDSFDPRTEAVVEQRGGQADLGLRSLRPGARPCTAARNDRVTVRSYLSDSVTLDVGAACPGMVVLPDTYFPGWEATVNGRSAPIYATNGAFRGVVVPAGRSTLKFRYQPAPFRNGIVIAFLGLLGFVGIAGYAMWRRRFGSKGRHSRSRHRRSTRHRLSSQA